MYNHSTHEEAGIPLPCSRQLVQEPHTCTATGTRRLIQMNKVNHHDSLDVIVVQSTVQWQSTSYGVSTMYIDTMYILGTKACTSDLSTV